MQSALLIRFELSGRLPICGRPHHSSRPRSADRRHSRAVGRVSPPWFGVRNTRARQRRLGHCLFPTGSRAPSWAQPLPAAEGQKSSEVPSARARSLILISNSPLRESSYYPSSFRGPVWVGRAGRDRWVFLEARLQIRHDLHGWSRDPCVAHSRLRIFLLRIGDEIEHLRLAELRGWRPPVTLIVVEDPFQFLHFTASSRSATNTGRPSRLDLFDLPSRKSVWSTPSIGRSCGTVAPAIVAKVAKVSTSCTISLLTRPAAIRPGQRMMKGTLSEPSICVK